MYHKKIILNTSAKSFVMNTEKKLEQTYKDYQLGKIGNINN